ncbi:MAG: hypothetical protein H6838_15055 [Planctomycetes bacterium]|nr:hypothetical protein [Planctomycetota bacterium]
MRLLAPLVTSWLLIAPALPGQKPPGAPMPQDLATLTATPTPSGPADLRWQLARKALDAGEFGEARGHLLAALEFHADSPTLLFDFVRACGEDPDLLALWVERWLRAASNPQGRFKLDPAQRKLVTASKAFDKQLGDAQKLAQKRAAAATSISRLITKLKTGRRTDATERTLTTRWAAELLLSLCEGAPPLLADKASAIEAIEAGFAPDHAAVITGLSNLLADKADLADERPLRAARLLLGLQRQRLMADVRGQLPEDLASLDRAAEAARAVVAAAADSRAAGKIWTIPELEAMSPAEAERFTAEHRSWNAPGVALSTTGRYRVETTCGHDTLLGVARTVELHHTRLVSHFGSDPFLQRLGIVRIVPDQTDMETDGAPHWWAAGFQGGDVTTIRFFWGNLPGLGHTLTHELTHRFDGVLRPFLPGWYVEGHADWTAKHYASMAETQFTEDFLDVGTVARVNGMGYGDRARFEQLLGGKVEDYRDNYPVGYSLYAFLRGHPPGGPWPYRAALQTYERNARAGQKDPLAYFTSVFCDGANGRAASFDEFVAAWQAFLRGCSEWRADRKKGNEWVGRYGGLGSGDPTSLVMDEPTWSWARTREEPFFGQGHAALAALLLHETGDRDGALAAGLWSLDVDGWRPDTVAVLRELFSAGKDKVAPGAFAALARQRFRDTSNDAAVPTGTLAAVDAYLAALAERRDALAATQCAVAAAAADAELTRLRDYFAPATAVAGPSVAPPPLPRSLGGHGYTETSLVDYDRRREPGLWFTTPDGDLQVGRKRPREGTGTVDRQSLTRDAFVHSVAWHGPGAYVVRGRVHFTTAYVAGAIVFGHQRRDRNLRLRFSAGDFDYSAGRSERDHRQGVLDVKLEGLWERDGNLPDTIPSAQIDLPAGQSWFDFALHVRGARALVEINGEAVCRYAVHDGSPIEGQIGFAMSTGAIRVQQPTVQELATGTAAAVTGLDLGAQPMASLEDLLLLPTRGIPRSPNGTLVVWLSSRDDGSPIDNLPRAMPVLARLLNDPVQFPQLLVLAVPAGLPAEDRDVARRQLAEVRGAEVPVLEHRVGEPLRGHYPFVLFVDHQGVLRAAAEVSDPALHSKVQKWAQLFRSR